MLVGLFLLEAGREEPNASTEQRRIARATRGTVMHIQLDEAQVIWWALSTAAGTVIFVISTVWWLLNYFRTQITQQITSQLNAANSYIKLHMDTEESRWEQIDREFREIKGMFVVREVLDARLEGIEKAMNFRLGEVESKIELIRKVIDTRRVQLSSCDNENSERPI